MKRCPNCEADTVVVHNIQDGTEFCLGCAPPSFSIYSLLTLGDLEFLKQCGIDPDLPDVLRRIAELARVVDKD